MRQAERAFTWAILAFTVAYALDATTIDVRLRQQVSAAVFPLAAAIFTAVSSGIVLISSRRSRDNDRSADIGRTGSSSRRWDSCTGCHCRGLATWWRRLCHAGGLAYARRSHLTSSVAVSIGTAWPSGSCSWSCSACHCPTGTRLALTPRDRQFPPAPRVRCRPVTSQPGSGAAGAVLGTVVACFLASVPLQPWRCSSRSRSGCPLIPRSS